MMNEHERERERDGTKEVTASDESEISFSPADRARSRPE